MGPIASSSVYCSIPRTYRVPFLTRSLYEDYIVLRESGVKDKEEIMRTLDCDEFSYNRFVKKYNESPLPPDEIFFDN